VIRRYEQVIAVSSGLHAEARRLGVPHEHLSLIENGVDTEEYRCSGVPRSTAGPLHIGAAGRLTPEKGFLELIAAVEAMLEEGHDIRLSIAGDGPQRGALEERIRASRHSSRLALVGFIDDMRTFYAELDLFCLSSLREGLPNVVLEAMAMSLPVVATTAGGAEHVSARRSRCAALRARVAPRTRRRVAHCDRVAGAAPPARSCRPCPCRARMLVCAADAARVHRLRSTELNGLAAMRAGRYITPANARARGRSGRRLIWWTTRSTPRSSRRKSRPCARRET
jgi:hypothetical protein